jgi:hypothetical protein
MMMNNKYRILSGIDDFCVFNGISFEKDLFLEKLFDEANENGFDVKI